MGRFDKYTNIADAQGPFRVRRESLVRNWNTDAIIGSEIHWICTHATYTAARAAMDALYRFDEDGMPLDDEVTFAVVDSNNRVVSTYCEPRTANDEEAPLF